MRVRARVIVVVASIVASGASPAAAGGLFLPGSGAISTSRAGAAVASADDGEALSINPAGLAKSHGTTITISAALIRYSMQFTRRGTYDDIPGVAQPYEGTKYQTIENQPKPPLGIGSVQPIPVIAVVTDLGGKVPWLRLAAGIYAPNAYPFRDMTGGYQFENGDPSKPPPAARYDIMKQESQLLFPSLAAAFRLGRSVDLGVRVSAGRAKSKSTVMVWGTPGNVDESIGNDTQFTAEVADDFVPTFGVGIAFRPTRSLEFAAVYNSAAVLHTKGTAVTVKGTDVDQTRVVGPIPDAMSRCETGGTFEAQKACISLQLPQNATVAARYKMFDEDGALSGDLELDVGWENWGKRCDYSYAGIMKDPDCTSPGQFLVNLDSGLYINNSFEQPLEINSVNLGLQDTYSVRLGGSLRGTLYTDHTLILRGGIGYDTQAARDGWFRANLDGASRLTATLGGGYRTERWELNLGGGVIFEGTNTNGGAGPGGADCNPSTTTTFGCVGNGSSHPIEDRQGPDPTNPLLRPEDQFENPVNQGTFKSHYVLLMLGFSTWF
jgi:long-subunit fatty acid transport protein